MMEFKILHVVVLLVLAALTEAQGSGPPKIVSFPEKDMDRKGEITASNNKFRIPCKGIGDNLVFTWKQFDLDDNSRLMNTYVKKDDPGRDAVVVEADGTLVGKETINPKFDNGYYQCFVQNSKGTAFSRKLRLQITSVSKFATNSAENYGVKDVGTIVTLKCPPLAKPLESYGFTRLWGKRVPETGTSSTLGQKENRIIRASDGQLTFSPLMQEDCVYIKDYTSINCRVEAASNFYASANREFTCSSTVNSDKISPVWLQQLEAEKEAVEGKEVNMYCAASGSPTPKVKWYFNDKTDEIKDGENGYELQALTFNRLLIIKTVNKVQHEGKYTCTVDNGVGQSMSSSTQLRVSVRPKLKDRPALEISIPINSDHPLTCLATGHPAPTYSWWKNGKQLPAGSPASVYKFTNAQLSDDGIYQCVATNKVGMVVTSTQVKVLAKKPSFKYFGPFPLFKKSTGKLPCKPDAAPAPNQYVWYYKESELKTNTSGGRYILSGDGTLLIDNVVKSDEGNYRCKATNIIGADTSPEGFSTVYDQTLIKVPPKNITVPEGKVFDLRCEADFDNRLEIRYYWQKDGFTLTNIQDSSRRVYWDESKNVLRVKAVEIDDAGEYTCVAFTPGPAESEARASAVVNIKGVPDPPSNLQVTDCKDLATILSWVPGAPNDSPITHFLVEQESDFEPNVFVMIKNITSANATSTSLVLTPWANLRFRVRAVNSFGRSRGSAPTAQGACVTKEAVPDRAPDNLRGVPGGPGELNITWTPLSKLEQNAPDCNYTLQYKRKDSSEWKKEVITDPTVGLFKVENAGYYIEWEFNIQTKNRKGAGPVSATVSSFSGQDAPKFPPTGLRDITPGPRFVEITWDPVKVDPERGRGSIDGYRIYYISEGRATVETKRRRRAIPESASTAEVLSKDACTNQGFCKHKFEGFKPYQKYRLMMRAFNSGGTGPASDEESFQTKEDAPSIPVDVSVIPFGKYILLRWGPPVEENGVMKGYVVGVVKTTGNHLAPEKPKLETKLRPNQFEYLFEDLDHTTDYRVGVAGETGGGFGPAVYLSALTVRPMVPAKPAVPVAKGITTSSVNVTFEYGSGGGYPVEFIVKYKEKVSAQGTTTPDPSLGYKESEWIITKNQRWVEIKNLPNTLHEFRTVGKNDLGTSLWSDPVDERPLPGVLSGKRESSPFYASGWFIVLIIIIVLLLLALVILVLVKKQRGAKYPVGKRERERAGILETFPEDEEAGFDTVPRDLENPPPYQSQGSLDKPSLANESDRDSLDDYGEGPQFNEDGSFIGEYGDDDKKNPPADKDNPALATFV